MARSDKDVLLETSVVINCVFEEVRFQARINKMFADLNREGIRWKVPSRVEQESRENIRRLNVFLQHTVDELYTKVKSEHQKIGKPELEFDPKDIDIIRRHFLEVSNRGSEPEKRGSEQLETFIVAGIEEAQRKGHGTVTKSFAWLKAELRNMIGNIELGLDLLLLEIVGTGSTKSDVDKLKPDLAMIKESDLFLLAEVINYSSSSGLKCLLVSVDYTDFVTNSEQIEARTGVICVDPLFLIGRYNGA